MDYKEVDFFNYELPGLMDENQYPAEVRDLERLAKRSALACLINGAKMEGKIGYKNADQRNKIESAISDYYKRDALKFSIELGINAETIVQKIDSIEIEPFKDMDTLMREWYPNSILRTYVKIRDAITRRFSGNKSANAT